MKDPCENLSVGLVWIVLEQFLEVLVIQHSCTIGPLELACLFVQPIELLVQPEPDVVVTMPAWKLMQLGVKVQYNQILYASKIGIRDASTK